MSVNKNFIYELSLSALIDSVGDVEILRRLLINQGIQSNKIIELNHRGRNFLLVYFSLLRNAQRIQRKLHKLKLKNVRIILKTVEPKQWEDRWKEDFKPFSLTKEIEIVPIWFKNHYSPKKKEQVYIDTKFAFGTGLHETTRFMAQLIENYRGQFNRFFDIGTGTGILAMIAHKCGARDIQAIDIDPDAVKVAQKNFKENQCTVTGIKTADINKLKTSKQYDFVAANLVTHDLIKMNKKIVSLVRPGKYLAISGIALENLGHIKKAFNTRFLRCRKIKKGRKWAAVLYQKTN